MTKCDYVLVLDTEGLHAPELDSQKTQKHDKELATFFTGLANATMINIILYGEAAGDMDDILQTVVHAFIRMRTIRLSPSCQFIHQNVGALMAKTKGVGRYRFIDKLDTTTREAAKEQCEEQCEHFSDVIEFAEQKDVHYLPSLWSGDSPMAPIHPGYSEGAQDLD